MRNYPMAVEFYTKALARNPNYMEAKNNLGICYDLMGSIDKAYTQFESALKTSPNNSAIYNNMGITAKRDGKLGRAIESYEAAIEADPKYSLGHYNYGIALLEQEKFQDAMQAFGKCKELNENNLFAVLALGYTLEMLGKSEEALMEYEIVRKKHPEFEGIEEKYNALKQSVKERDKQHKEKKVKDKKVRGGKGFVIKSINVKTESKKVPTNLINKEPVTMVEEATSSKSKGTPQDHPEEDKAVIARSSLVEELEKDNTVNKSLESKDNTSKFADNNEEHNKSIEVREIPPAVITAPAIIAKIDDNSSKEAEADNNEAAEDNSKATKDNDKAVKNSDKSVEDIEIKNNELESENPLDSKLAQEDVKNSDIAEENIVKNEEAQPLSVLCDCLLYTSPSPRD
eukprot:TRINITY_DN10128_c0_g2_i15.p1 TRINITY_DN10128_c0_g2~~TRINITY_DN10128_c0_g2_i15.p1  ORF type:complete len:400 (-),score=110.66 TRINITY_DN10128_c0_g2_i15:53-1252(-)